MKVTMRDGSGTAELTYLVEDADRHGNVRLYVKKRGVKKIRLTAEPGTPEFMAEYRAAFSRVTGAEAAPESKRIGADSLRWLCQQYYASADFKSLAERTRHVRKLRLDAVCDVTLGEKPNGMLPYAMLEKRHIRRMRDAKADTPESANDDVKALRQLFKWAADVYDAQNPAKEVPYLKGKAGGWHTWAVEEVEAYHNRHAVGTKARLAIDLLLFTGVRRSDVVKLGPQNERNGRLCFTETKGGNQIVKEHAFLILPVLRASIDATPCGHLAYLTTAFNKPFTHGGFGNWFRRRCNEAGLKHCSAHGLRKAGATIAAENGATAFDLMAIYGWTNVREAETYTRKANRKHIADRAIHLLVPKARNVE